MMTGKNSVKNNTDVATADNKRVSITHSPTTITL